MDQKGISVLFLVTAMLLMITMGYLLSYLIPTKQKSIKFPIFSNQAFYLAQSGIEYGIRYSSDRGWRGTTDSGTYDLTHLNDPTVYQRNLGNGRFTINYTPATNTLTSTGEVTNSSEKRIIAVSNFTPFLRLIFDPDSLAPRWVLGTRQAQFYIKNVRGTDVILTSFAASWSQTGPARKIRTIEMNGVAKYSSGNYFSDPDLSPPIPLNDGGGSQTIAPGQVINVLVAWNANLGNGEDIIIKFFTAAGDGYAFNLDPESDGLP